MIHDDNLNKITPFEDVSKITSLFDILINQNDIIDQKNNTFWLDNAFIRVSNGNKDILNSFLKRGAKKFVFNSNESCKSGGVQFQYSAISLNPENLPEVEFENFVTRDIICNQTNENSIQKIRTSLQTNNLEQFNVYLIVQKFSDQELALIKEYKLRPIVQLKEPFNLNNVFDWFIKLIFDGTDNLIPTITQDSAKNILMQAFSNRESLKKAIETNTGTYFSRSRQKLWTKGETSGNVQKLFKVRYDCDFDSLIFTVEQSGNACHKNSYSCFNTEDFDFNSLYSIIENRKNNFIKNSYTSKILQNEQMIMDKIQEECLEVVNYKDKDNLVWELGDIIYFLQVLMVNKNIKLAEVLAELRRRNVINVK